jgi:hypothetical protein
MREIIRKILIAIALDFLSSSSGTGSVYRRYIHEEEMQGDDPVKLPAGKVVKITVEYFDENKIKEDGE